MFDTGDFPLIFAFHSIEGEWDFTNLFWFMVLHPLEHFSPK